MYHVLPYIPNTREISVARDIISLRRIEDYADRPGERGGTPKEVARRLPNMLAPPKDARLSGLPPHVAPPHGLCHLRGAPRPQGHCPGPAVPGRLGPDGAGTGTLPDTVMPPGRGGAHALCRGAGRLLRGPPAHVMCVMGSTIPATKDVYPVLASNGVTQCRRPDFGIPGRWRRAGTVHIYHRAPCCPRCGVAGGRRHCAPVIRVGRSPLGTILSAPEPDCAGL